jgi:hypothetical protein
MIESKMIRDFLKTKNLDSGQVSAIEERLTRVEVKSGLLKGSFSDCDTEYVLGDAKLEEEFTLFHDQAYGFAPDKLTD